MTLSRGKRKAEQSVQSSAPNEPRGLYERDVVAWAEQQAQLLRERRFDVIDVETIADEVADAGRRETRATRSALRLVLQHLLNWDHQPLGRSRSWALTIRAQHRAVDRQLDDNPSLRARLETLVLDAYADARDEALIETNLPEAALPGTCPYAWDDIMHRPVVWSDPS